MPPAVRERQGAGLSADRIAAAGPAHGLDQVLRRRALRDVGVGPGFDHGAGNRLVFVKREADDDDLGMPPLDSPGRFDAVQGRHVQIHNDRVRLQGFGLSDGLFAVGDFPDYFKIRLAVEQADKAFAHHGVVVGNDQTEHTVPGP
jgi:hypothetical protein